MYVVVFHQRHKRSKTIEPNLIHMMNTLMHRVMIWFLVQKSKVEVIGLKFLSVSRQFI